MGAPLATRLAGRFGAGAAAIGFASAGLALLASLVIRQVPAGLFVALGPIVRSWTARELTRGLAATLALVVPVVAMGTTFPSSCHARLASAPDVGA